MRTTAGNKSVPSPATDVASPKGVELEGDKSDAKDQPRRVGRTGCMVVGARKRSLGSPYNLCTIMNLDEKCSS